MSDYPFDQSLKNCLYHLPIICDSFGKKQDLYSMYTVKQQYYILLKLIYSYIEHEHRDLLLS